MTSRPWASLTRLAEALGIRPLELQAIAQAAGRYYKPYDLVIPGKKPRHIDNPRGRLRVLQKLLTRRILRRVAFPAFIFGSVRGRSIIDMAKLHVRKPCVVAVDIRACFPSTRAELVRTALVKHAGFGRETAALATQLTTVHDSLPQGAPSSSYLLNLAMLGIHEQLHRQATRQGLTYTVFVDDIVVSGKHPEPMVDDIAAALRAHGFQLSHKKKRVMRDDAQEVLGLRLNPKLDAKPAFYERFDDLVSAARDAGTITTKTLQRLDGMVNHLSNIDASLGTSLRTVRDLLLDSVHVLDGDDATTSNPCHQPCRHRRRHRRHSTEQPSAHSSSASP